MNVPATAVGRVQRVLLPDGERTWTVVDGSHLVVAAAEEFLEFMRATRRSPNTIKSYARALALWWEFLGAYGLAWDEVKVDDFGAFLTWLRSGDTPAVASIAQRPARFSEETIAVRLQAVMSLYRHHHLNGVDAASRLYERLPRPGGAYKPFLEHIARRRPSARQVVKVKRARPSVPPTLTPPQIEVICDACACWDAEGRQWVGTLRDRLLWALLAETGLRLGEALGLQHRDWHTGRGDVPFIEVRPREHAHGVRVRAAPTASCTSPTSWTGSTASTCSGCATPASTCSLRISTHRACSSTWPASRAMSRCARRPSTGWFAGCGASSRAGCRSGSRRTGSVTRTPLPCFCPAFPRMWSHAAWGTAMCRRR
jgi:site-specific recombinase XerD